MERDVHIEERPDYLDSAVKIKDPNKTNGTSKRDILMNSFSFYTK